MIDIGIMKAKDYDIKPGDKFGKLTVIKRINDKKDKYSSSSYFLCKCSCNNETIIEVDGYNLISGHTKSCGCIKNEKLIERNTKHNMSKYRTFKIYYGMLDRCTNVNCSGYKKYGEKGIKICDEWYDKNSEEFINLEKFRNFHNWAITHPTYREDYTIDRLDPKGDYEPSNCIWSNPREQANNRTSNRYIDFGGCKYTMGQVANILGIQYRYLDLRFYYANHDFSKIYIPYTYDDGVILNSILYGRYQIPIPINAIYFIDNYGRPITEQQYEENQNRLQPAIWSINEFGFITEPYKNREED